MVGPLANQGTIRDRMRDAINENGAAMSPRALAMAVLGKDNDSAVQQMRNNVKQDGGRTFTRMPGGFIDVVRDLQKPAIRVINTATEEPDELPF